MRETLSKWNNKKWFSTVDLASSFYQMELAEESRPVTAFQVDGNKYQFRRLPMGLATSPAHLMHVMSRVVEGLDANSLRVYMDR